MSKPGLILIGAGGHAHACIDVLEQSGHYRIAGLVGRPDDLHSNHLGYPVFATDDELPRLANEYRYALIAVGQIRSPDRRIRLFQRLKSLGFELPTVVASTAYVSGHAMISAGTVVMHGAIVNAGARVGENCIINTRALVEHDAIVEDHCHISTGAIVNGGAIIGAGSFLGSRSVVKENIKLGNGCVVGMGISVRHSQADFARIVS